MLNVKSRRGFTAAIVFLSAFPAALLCQTIFGINAELIIHFACAFGFALISLSVFDFKLPRWINWAGCAATLALASIFLLQGAAQLIQNDSLTFFAFAILGQALEARLVDLLLLWFAALLLFDSRGWTRIFGFAAMAIVACAVIYGYYLAYLGAEASVLKLLYLLPFVWFLLESKKAKTTCDADRRKQIQ